MRVSRVAGAAFWIMLTSAAVMAQPRTAQIGPGPNAPGESTFISTYPSSGVIPTRRLQIRSESGGREVVTEIVETPDIDGRFAPSLETSSETVRTASNAVQTTREVFGFGISGRRLLMERTRTDEETFPDGTTTILQNTWTPDLDGRLILTSRQIEHIQTISPDERRTDSAEFRPGVDGTAQTGRVTTTERHAGLDLVRRDTTLFVRDVNGRLQPTESRSQELRISGPSEYTEEETIHRLDVNGNLILTERNVTSRSQSGGVDRTVLETFSLDIGGVIRSDNHLELSQRVRRTTTPDAEGGGRTIEEVEERVASSPAEPVRIVRRSVETIKRVDAGRWESDLQLFNLDPNGRLVLVERETGEMKQ